MKDLDIINNIMKQMYSHLGDDGSPLVEDFNAVGILTNINNYILKAIEDEKIFGLFFFYPRNYILYETHACILPENRGKQAVEAGKLAYKWIFDNTECKKIVAFVPHDNKLAYIFARQIGLKYEGVLKNSIMRNGKLLNQHMLTIEKEGDVICQQ